MRDNRETGVSGCDGGEILRAPTPARIEASRIADYLRWLHASRDRYFDDYQSLRE